MSSRPRRQRGDSEVVAFVGGPRDGDWLTVVGKPAVFEIPASGFTPRPMLLRYERRDGAYRYAGQFPDDSG